MRILERATLKDGSEFMTLSCHSQEDLWHLYNIVRPGDYVEAETTRRMTLPDGCCRTKPTRKTMVLEIEVRSTNYDPQHSGIRFQGFTTYKTEDVKSETKHLLDIKLHAPFRLTKKSWDLMDIQRIEDSQETHQDGATAAVVLHEGVAQICLVSNDRTIVKAKVEMPVARKRAGFCINHEKSLQDFLETVAKTFLRHIKVESMKSIIVAGRGFVHKNFLTTLYDVAEQMHQPFNKKQKAKFVCLPAKEETAALGKFMDLFNNDPSRAFYGDKHVFMANEHNAIDTLMISDTLFRSNDNEKRKEYIQFVDNVKKTNAKVLIFSSLHESGRQLNMMTGIAAILRYPLPELEDEDIDDDEEEQERDIIEAKPKVDEMLNKFGAHFDVSNANVTNGKKDSYESYNDPFEYESDDEPDAEETAPRPQITITDCIVRKR
uniref:ERF1_1 domain-containing protein n=1 Tax=Panagrellus redivivus TaxID=6233 RepID=A0A7E4W5V8_PANRE